MGRGSGAGNRSNVVAQTRCSLSLISPGGTRKHERQELNCVTREGRRGGKVGERRCGCDCRALSTRPQQMLSSDFPSPPNLPRPTVAAVFRAFVTTWTRERNRGEGFRLAVRPPQGLREGPAQGAAAGGASPHAPWAAWVGDRVKAGGASPQSTFPVPRTSCQR